MANSQSNQDNNLFSVLQHLVESSGSGRAIADSVLELIKTGKISKQDPTIKRFMAEKLDANKFNKLETEIQPTVITPITFSSANPTAKTGPTTKQPPDDHKPTV